MPQLLVGRLVAERDAGMLAGLCQSWAVFVLMSKKLNKLLADEGSDPMDVRRTAASANDAFRSYHRAALEFGLSPSSRSRLSIELPSPVVSGKERFFARGLPTRNRSASGPWAGVPSPEQEAFEQDPFLALMAEREDRKAREAEAG